MPNARSLAEASFKAPPRIRTDAEYPFAHHTMAVRVPAIIQEVIERNPDYSKSVLSELRALQSALREGRALPALAPDAPFAASWLAELDARAGEGWLSTDWFFAETYAYRQIVERVRFWDLGADPFGSHKFEEYASRAHAEAFEGALTIDGSPEARAEALLGASLFGNRIDLSFAASRAHGAGVDAEDLLADDRKAAIRSLFEGHGPLHVILDNVGTELTLDLVLADFALHVLRAEVALHVKVHPTFVSDATAADVKRFLDPLGAPRAQGSRAQQACIDRLAAACTTGQLSILPHAYWNGPLSLWELPLDLAGQLEPARLVLLKGDANYRRALNDALWPPTTSFVAATEYFPAPLLALRTLKSDPIVGLAEGRAEALNGSDPTWRVNGRRGVASLGGRLARAG
jgi:uncharacterized protein with ATP-grasp and redox domains